MQETKDSLSGETADVTALAAVVQALKGLPPEARHRVTSAALVLLGNTPKAPLGQDGDRAAGSSDAQGVPTDIRTLSEQKQPKGASEMAAVTAYYLAEAASPSERKTTVENADMVRYFKQAKFKLPSNTTMILVHAKNAGYFDSAGGGKYRLNPVGYNLVTHSLPRSDTESARPRRQNRGRGKSKRKS